jgi:flagellar biosynthesis protein FlhG
MSKTSPKTIAVASGKGGVGKTWCAITLAHALARNGRRVLLFDGDLGLANVDVQLGLMPEQDLGSVLAGRSTLNDAILAVDAGGFEVIPGRSGSGDLSGLAPAALEGLLHELGEAGAVHDHILLDLGAGVGRSVRRMAAWADALLVLSTDEPTSLTDSYATLKLYAADRPGGDARLIVNQATGQAAGERTAETLTRVCKTFLGRAPEMAGIIRKDTRVPDAIRRQALLLTRHPCSPAGADLERIAAKL